MRKIRIDSACYLWWAFLVLVLPLRWLSAAFTAAAFHELCHYLAIRLLGGQFISLTVSPAGARIQMTPISYGRELVAALAGPVGGLTLLLFFRWMPLTALCGLIHSLWNLIPIYPLDGGRAVLCAALLFLEESTARKLCRWVGIVTAAILLWIIVSCSLLPISGFLPLILLLPYITNLISGKIPCKTARQRVQ